MWLAADPARGVLRASGEELLPESQRYTDATPALEKMAGRFGVHLTNPIHMLKMVGSFKELVRYFRSRKTNLGIFKQVTERERFDLIIGDESYDIGVALANNPALKRAPFAMIHDFVGYEATSRNPLEWVWAQMMNSWWPRHLRRLSAAHDLSLFVGEKEDVPEKMFGLFLPNRRKPARAAMRYVGYICQSDSADCRDRARLRERLGYGPEPLVLCSIGGTAIGKALLELCGRAYPLIKKELPDLRMVLVCGPRLSPDGLRAPKGVDRRGYVHGLYEHLAACDLAIVQGGGTTTLELVALRRPFLY
ncbi:MAG TPA: hypothetical protein VMZ50_06845, partial [Phycisphaerae bacterium]|nr:hypothetical protein [Phycisphaerae bacterium]